MEHVFDLREFLLIILRKFKLALILGLILCLVGGLYGYVSYPANDLIKTSSSARISLSDTTKDATALTNATTTINAVVTYDSFFVGILQELSAQLSEADLKFIFSGKSTPKIPDMKKVIDVYVKGSVVYADAICNDDELSQRVSQISIDYAISEIPDFFDGSQVTFLKQQTLNLTTQNNATRLKETLKFGILGLLGGIVLAVLWIFFVDIFDLRVKGVDDLKKYKLPIFYDTPIK